MRTLLYATRKQMTFMRWCHKEGGSVNSCCMCVAAMSRISNFSLSSASLKFGFPATFCGMQHAYHLTRLSSATHSSTPTTQIAEVRQMRKKGNAYKCLLMCLCDKYVASSVTVSVGVLKSNGKSGKSNLMRKS